MFIDSVRIIPAENDEGSVRFLKFSSLVELTIGPACFVILEIRVTVFYL